MTDPLEIVAKEMRDLDAKRAGQQAWMEIVLAQLPWEKCSEGAKAAWIDDLKSGLRKLRERTLGLAWIIMPDGSLQPLGPIRSADGAERTAGEKAT